MTTLGLILFFPIAFGTVMIALAVLQVLKPPRGSSSILKALTYLAFFLTLGGATFGKFYASKAPARLEPIESSMPAEAISGYTQAIRLNPTDADLFYRRGRTDFHLYRYADAIQDFNRALELSPGDLRFIASRGFSYFAIGDDRSAQTDISRVINSGYRDPETHMVYGLLLQGQSRFQEAVREYSNALAQPDLGSVNRCTTLLNRGVVYVALKGLSKAKSDFDEVIAKCAMDRESALVNRASVKSLSRDRNGAFSDWEEALRLDPNDAVVYKNRGGEYVDAGLLRSALTDYDRYLSLRPNDAEAFMVRATIHANLGDGASAQADREKALELVRTKQARIYGPSGIIYTPRQ